MRALLSTIDNVVLATPAPEIKVEGRAPGGNWVEIIDGDTTPETVDGTDFGSIEQNGGEILREYRITNIGDDKLYVGAVQTPPSGGFGVRLYPAPNLDPQQSTIFSINLASGTVGVFEDFLSFGNDDADENPFNFKIKGAVTTSTPTVPEVGVTGLNGNEILDGDTNPTPIDGTDFGTALRNQTTISKTFTVRNTGTTTLTLAALTVPAGFTITEQLVSSLAPNTSDSFTIRLDNGVVGTKSGEVKFDNNDSDENPFEFRVTGVVTTPTPAPEIRVTGLNGDEIHDGDLSPIAPDGTDFGSVFQGQSTVSRTFTVTNHGDATLSLGTISAPAGYTITDGLVNSLAPLTSDTFTVRLDNTQTGSKLGFVSFTNNDSDESPFEFKINGMVTSPPTLRPEIVVTGLNDTEITDDNSSPNFADGSNFGTVTLGQSTSVSRTFRVSNDGDATLTLGAISVPEGFTITEGLTTGLIPNTSDTFTLLLDSSIEGVKSGWVTFGNSDSDENPFNFRIQGLVVLPPVAELTEGNAATWAGFAPTDNAPTIVADDTSRTKTGSSSIHLRSESGFDTGIRYPKAGEANWNVMGFSHLVFFVNGNNSNPNGWQGNQPIVKLLGSSGTYTYEPVAQQMPTQGWSRIAVPLAGSADWPRKEDGIPSLSDVDAIEIHMDTWNYGFDAYFDGMHFAKAPRLTVPNPVTLNVGQSLKWIGSFTDADGNPWSATIDYGDGNGSEALPLLPNNSFSLLHQYTRAGTFTVTVSVSDATELESRRSFGVVVTSPASNFTGSPGADYAVFRPSTQQWFVLDNRGKNDSSVDPSSGVRWGLPGDIPLDGDFTGDGKADFAVYRPSTGQWFVLENPISPPSIYTPGIQWGMPGDEPVPADFTGDAKADYALYRPSTGQWFVLDNLGKGRAAANPSSGVTWGMPGDVPVPSDYTGDGKADFAVYRPSTGQWFVLENPISPPSIYTPGIQWGLPGDVPIPTDFSGDGKADYAVFRPSTGQWFLLDNLGKGLAAVNLSSGVAWGMPGDIPILGDYTADVEADFAVFRPSFRQWFVLRNPAPPAEMYANGIQWGMSGDVPVSAYRAATRLTIPVKIASAKPTLATATVRASAIPTGVDQFISSTGVGKVSLTSSPGWVVWRAFRGIRGWRQWARRWKH